MKHSFGQEASPVVPTFECPVCRKQFTVKSKEEAPHRPFCSTRCKMVDLGRWFDGTYRISEPISRDESEELPHEDREV